MKGVPNHMKQLAQCAEHKVIRTRQNLLKTKLSKKKKKKNGSEYWRKKKYLGSLNMCKKNILFFLVKEKNMTALKKNKKKKKNSPPTPRKSNGRSHIIFTILSLYCHDIGRTMRKHVFGKAQISLLIRADCAPDQGLHCPLTESLNSTTAKAQINLRIRAV